MPLIFTFPEPRQPGGSGREHNTFTPQHALYTFFPIERDDPFAREPPVEGRTVMPRLGTVIMNIAPGGYYVYVIAEALTYPELRILSNGMIITGGESNMSVPSEIVCTELGTGQWPGHLWDLFHPASPRYPVHMCKTFVNGDVATPPVRTHWHASYSVVAEHTHFGYQVNDERVLYLSLSYSCRIEEGEEKHDMYTYEPMMMAM
ncbi:uncharacterized protein BT62DRAFT_1080145 [Guyanagaster necrorhizus]|uniref:Uncharacterized protein n=1 Tax=Guyanagaster necrorhizus TaxID=856835 RepID=A0A9P7VIP7_9AGAR|nr:uncharacterized protein BT62DRAFT_1080145 [Guyanagaster necrorhizus MCA 3950]KAG7441414.1 hypothetical protein BT62DRAFT_1080145 [Guyanagaster necrorhizus MCA 3950]